MASKIGTFVFGRSMKVSAKIPSVVQSNTTKELSSIIGKKVISQPVNNPKMGNYNVVVLSEKEAQKLADHNFEKYLKDLEK